MTWRTFGVLLLAACMASLVGCSREAVGGAAAGALGAGAAYEYQANQAMNELEEEYERGEIDRDEYERRKKEIEKRSIIE